MALVNLLIGAVVINIEGLSDKRYNLNGFLIEFTIKDTTYIYIEYNKFKNSDLGLDNGVKSGYYQKNKFFEYKINKVALSELLNSSLRQSSSIKYGQKGDTLVIKALHIGTTYDFFYRYAEYSFIYNGKPEDLLDDRLEIKIPEGIEPNYVDKSDSTFPAKEFYRKRKDIINNFSVEEKPKAALELTKIALVIDMINKDIFPAFYLGDTSYTSFVTSQNDYWQNADLFVNPTLAQLDLFLKQLTGYYIAASSNVQVIAEAIGIQKLYWIASVMSPMSLGPFPLEDKLILLQFIAKNELSKLTEEIPQEELVINICSSFDDTNLSQIDLFLRALISKQWKVDTSSDETLFETLYLSLSTSTNFKEGLLSLSNWVMGTNYKPTQTKGQFIQTIYALWTLSKYNPYNIDGSLKSNTIAFPEKNNDLVSFTNTSDTSNYLFKFTHYTASDPFYWPNSTDIKGYKKVRPDASPIVMPYDSYSVVGIFFDNFSFKFNGSKISAFQSLPYISGYRTDGSGTEWKLSASTETFYGSYDIFQPVGLLSTNLETKTGISTLNGENIEENGQNINGFIPIFALKFIDDSGDRSDVETMIGYAVDVLTTATGFGNLTRLRYLRWASTGVDGIFSISGLRIVIAGVEFTSGALGLLANLMTCDENDEFCNGLKTFIKIFQVSSLSLTAVNGLISTTIYLQNAAAKLRQIAGGVNEAEIITNIKNRIRNLNSGANEADIDALGTSIYRTSQLNSFSAAIAAGIEIAIKNYIGKYKKEFKLRPEYTRQIIQNHIERCKELGIDSRTTEDLVIFSNRISADPTPDLKYINPTELEKRVGFLANVTRKRGYPGGFINKTNYDLFGNAFINTFKQNLITLSVELDEVGEIKGVVKGSAVISWKQGDDINGIPNLPGRQADDIDIAIPLTDNGFKKMVDELYILLEDDYFTKRPRIKEDFEIQVRKGKIQYNWFQKIPIENSNFTQKIIDACQPYTNFVPVMESGRLKQKIGFAIIRKGGKWDNFPEMPF